MTLREQLLSELRQQNEAAQKEIKELNSTISGESFAMSTLNGGALASVASSACKNRMQAASEKKAQIELQNDWISEMLSKYK